MKTRLMAIAAASMFASVAYAGSDSGTVASYVPETRVLTLESGKTYNLPQGVAIPPEIAPGSNVVLTTDDDNPQQVEMLQLAPG